MIDEIQFSSPSELKEAYSLLKDEKHWPLAGGTDLIPKMRRNTLAVETLVDINCFGELESIHKFDERIEIGALSTHSTIMDNSILRDSAISLAEAASSIGCQQTRNRGTIGGNIANASPAADMLPPLLTYDAVIHVGSLDKTREILLKDFLLGPGKTALLTGELIEAISFKILEGYGMSFLKLGKRNGMSISIASVAVAIAMDDHGIILDARIAMGSVAPTAVRCQQAERCLIGNAPSERLFHQASEAARDQIEPIDDVRASAEYRCTAAASLVARALVIAEGRVK